MLGVNMMRTGLEDGRSAVIRVRGPDMRQGSRRSFCL
jgi:hypothetical protein